MFIKFDLGFLIEETLGDILMSLATYMWSIIIVGQWIVEYYVEI